MGLGSIAAITALVTGPFGAAPELLQAGKPLYAFADQGPVLHLVRVQKVNIKSCQPWLDSLVEGPLSPSGSQSDFRPVKDPDSLKKAWSPWTEKDLDPVQDCDDFPCKVKFNLAETEAMKKTAQTERVAKFYSLVFDRVEGYTKTQQRKAYETRGEPIDPWKMLEEKGFKTAVPRPTAPALFARKLNFAPEKMLTIHQVVDRRVGRTPLTPTGAGEAVVWVRDAYTDHYFDSWGEWSSVHCDAAQGEAIVVQSLLSEMDLLKQTSIFARAIFGRYRSAFEDNGKIYLDAQFEALKSEALKKAAENQPAAAH